MLSHGETGLLVDFHQPDALAAQVIDVLKNPADYAHLGPAARHFITSHHDFLTCCLPDHLRRLNGLVPRNIQLDIPG
jgi:hypothetical protein